MEISPLNWAQFKSITALTATKINGMRSEKSTKIWGEPLSILHPIDFMKITRNWIWKIIRINDVSWREMIYRRNGIAVNLSFWTQSANLWGVHRKTWGQEHDCKLFILSSRVFQWRATMKSCREIDDSCLITERNEFVKFTKVVLSLW